MIVAFYIPVIPILEHLYVFVKEDIVFEWVDHGLFKTLLAAGSSLSLFLNWSQLNRLM